MNQCINCKYWGGAEFLLDNHGRSASIQNNAQKERLLCFIARYAIELESVTMFLPVA